MKDKQAEQMQSPDANKSAGTDRPAGNATSDPLLDESGSLPPALPPAQNRPACDPNCIDVTGKVPEGIHIDPDITEGHPGYEESGDSEIIPPELLAKGEGTGGDEKPVEPPANFSWRSTDQ
jgi:hypothetical protein